MRLYCYGFICRKTFCFHLILLGILRISGKFTCKIYCANTLLRIRIIQFCPTYIMELFCWKISNISPSIWMYKIFPTFLPQKHGAIKSFWQKWKLFKAKQFFFENPRKTRTNNCKKRKCGKLIFQYLKSK